MVRVFAVALVSLVLTNASVAEPAVRLSFTCVWVRRMVALAGGIDNAVAEARRRGFTETQIADARRRCL